MTELVNLEVPRNGVASLVVYFDDGGIPLNLTGYTFEMKVKLQAGDTLTLGTATVANSAPTTGEIDISLNGADFASIGSAFEVVRLAYDLVSIAGGVREIIMRGQIILIPGVS